ncbi:MAG: glycosyltransferase family 9 protein, partial [Nitrospinae bacterium]|nr:glycosyltransferase family 9 protein [Nitrospinota bacterium]
RKKEYSYTGDYLCDLTREFLAKMGFECDRENPPLVLVFSEEDEKKYLELMENSPRGKKVGIIPGSSFGPSRRWPIRYFAQTADALIESGYNTTFIYGPGEEDIVKEIIEKMHNEIRFPPLISLAVLKPFVKNLDLIISGDTGPRHYAAAFNIPSIVIMGPTSPEISIKKGENSVILRKVELDCLPCNKPDCIKTDYRCLTGIHPQEVIEESEKILGSGI